MDFEGGRNLETVDRYLSQLRQEFAESISQMEHAMTTILAELEIWFDKLELQVTRMASEKTTSTANPRSSSKKHGSQGK